MGAIKANNYSNQELEISMIARGLAHPARVKILNQLQKRVYRNIDFCRELRMNRSTIKEHLDKLIDADLISVEYFPHFYVLSLNEERMKAVKQLMNSGDMPLS